MIIKKLYAKFIQEEIVLAANSLKHLFPTAAKKFEPPISEQELWLLSGLFSDMDATDIKAARREFVKKKITPAYIPLFGFDNVTPMFEPAENLILMADDNITNYAIGHMVGSWLYFGVNPLIANAYSDYLEKIAKQAATGQPTETSEPMPDSRIVLACENLGAIISHYCGLTYNQKGRLQVENPARAAGQAEQSHPADVEHNVWTYQLERNARGMQIADILFERFTEDDFKPLPALGFEEARQRLHLQTGIDLMLP